MIAACRGNTDNHLRIAELMIQKGEPFGLDWNHALTNACQGGYLPIIELIISKGGNAYEQGLYHACYSGHLHVVEFIITKMEPFTCNWNYGLDGACEGEHLPVVLYMFQKGANCTIHSFLEKKPTQFYLLENGISRSQLSYILNIEKFFRELDIINQFIHQEIFHVLPFRDLVPLCTQYACL